MKYLISFIGLISCISMGFAQWVFRGDDLHINQERVYAGVNCNGGEDTIEFWIELSTDDLNHPSSGVVIGIQSIFPQYKGTQYMFFWLHAPFGWTENITREVIGDKVKYTIYGPLGLIPIGVDHIIIAITPVYYSDPNVLSHPVFPSYDIPFTTEDCWWVTVDEPLPWSGNITEMGIEQLPVRVYKFKLHPRIR